MKRWFSFLSAAIFLLLPGCGGAGEASAQFFAMDTVMTVTVYGRQGKGAVDAARAEINRLDRLFSRTREDSEIARLNAGGETALDGEVLALLELARSVSEASGGAFDVTIAPVMDAWGWTGGERRVPPPAELEKLLPLVNYKNLLLDPASGTACLTRPGMSADLGGVAKGYAAGRAASAVREAGAASALLDLGSNITAVGDKPDGTSWRIAVKDPQDTQNYICVLSLSDQTASTSGGYERYFEEDGAVYHHIIDPATGYPADTGLLSVTVVSENAALADALSTACFVLGPEEALELWRTGGGLDAFELVLCRTDGTVVVTEGLEEGLTFHGEEGGYVCEIARR